MEPADVRLRRWAKVLETEEAMEETEFSEISLANVLATEAATAVADASVTIRVIARARASVTVVGDIRKTRWTSVLEIVLVMEPADMSETR